MHTLKFLFTLSIRRFTKVTNIRNIPIENAKWNHRWSISIIDLVEGNRAMANALIISLPRFAYIIIRIKEPLLDLYPDRKSLGNTRVKTTAAGFSLNRSGVFWKPGKFKSPRPLSPGNRSNGTRRKETPLNYSQWRCLMGETINFRARKRFAYWICPTDFALNGPGLSVEENRGERRIILQKYLVESTISGRYFRPFLTIASLPPRLAMKIRQPAIATDSRRDNEYTIGFRN